jgi:hypothetical protein
VKQADRESPTYAPPESTSDFKYGAKDRSFLNVMTYYYLDQLITYLRGFNVDEYNNNVTGPIDVDSQAYYGDDNSHFDGTVSPPFIGFGEDTAEGVAGGVPDASDPGVIVHEYGHAIHYYLGTSQEGTGYEEGFNDFLAAAWLDRFNEHQFQREEVMPWDQHTFGTTHWDSTQEARRRVDLADRFDDGNFSSYGRYHKGDVLATALWDLFLNIGGGPGNTSAVRTAAADQVIQLYLETLTTLADNVPPTDILNALMTTDGQMTGGLYKKVIWDAFRRRGLGTTITPTGNVDPYIRDSDQDTGEHANLGVHCASPDIWVRNSPPPADPNDPNDPNHGENPDDGHQPPINDVPNYLYVRVWNRGTAVASGCFVEALHCDPGTAMQFPTDLKSMGTLSVPGNIAPTSSVRVGPFIWTPHIVDHECLFAVVDCPDDPAITKTVIGPVDHWKITRYDNNVGQRNVSPQSSVPGGKTKTSFFVRGTTHTSMNRLSIDASAMPVDTSIKVQIRRKLADQTGSVSDLSISSQTVRLTTYSLTGGKVGVIDRFPLAANVQEPVTLTIDFSYEAENLKRYPIFIVQEQDGVAAGQLTIEITAVKEAEDWVYGNRRTGELHTLNCPYCQEMSPHNKIPFPNIRFAQARGYEGCRFCLPEIDIR